MNPYEFSYCKDNKVEKLRDEYSFLKLIFVSFFIAIPFLSFVIPFIIILFPCRNKIIGFCDQIINKLDYMSRK
jgi:hypothetical protein